MKNEFYRTFIQSSLLQSLDAVNMDLKWIAGCLKDLLILYNPIIRETRRIYIWSANSTEAEYELDNDGDDDYL